MKYAVLAMVVLLTLSVSMAGAVHQPQSIQYYVDNYNNKIGSAPDLLKAFMGDERVNVNITEPDGSISRVGFETKRGIIVNTTEGYADPTITVTMTRDAIYTINRSNDPIATFQEEQRYGQVLVAATNFETRVKLGLLLASLPVLQFFANIFYG